MDRLHIAALALDFLFIGLLPVIFFRRDGRLNLHWWLTATPFFIVGGITVASLLGLLPAWSAPSVPAIAASLVATGLACGSIALIAFTIGTHRRRIALWHQDDDAPVEIVTSGPYGLVRHPFYTAFCMALLAALLALPSPATAAGFAWGIAALALTARREEARLLASPLGDRYREYMQQTGRLLPRFG